MHELLIRELRLTEWEIFKALRLQSLQDAPCAYGASYEEEAMLSDAAWKEMLLKKRYMLFAQLGTEVVGMVGAEVSDQKKRRHAAYITAMYVAREARGQGISKKLFAALLEKIEADASLVKATLRVTTTQEVAFALYQKFGFSLVGTMHKELCVNDQYYDMHVMEKILR